MYTIDQLQVMSDFEVNKALATILLDMQGVPYQFVETKPSKLEELRGENLSNIVSVVCGFVFRLDYCNNWNDVMPLAIEHGIHSGPEYGCWYAIYDASILSEELIEIEDQSPLRAIACCLILVLQSKE